MTMQEMILWSLGLARAQLIESMCRIDARLAEAAGHDGHSGLSSAKNLSSVREHYGHDLLLCNQSIEWVKENV